MKTIMFFLAICFSTCTFASEKSTHFYDENSGISVVIPAGLKKSWNVNNEQNGVNITVFNTSEGKGAVTAAIGQIPLSMLGDCSEEDCMSMIMNQMNMIPLGQIDPEALFEMEKDCGCTIPVVEKTCDCDEVATIDETAPAQEVQLVSCEAQDCNCNVSCGCEAEECNCNNTCSCDSACVEKVLPAACEEVCECDEVATCGEECDFPDFNFQLVRLEDVNFDNLSAKHFQFSMEVGEDSIVSNVYLFLDDQFLYVVSTAVVPTAEDSDLEEMSNNILKSVRFLN